MWRRPVKISLSSAVMSAPNGGFWLKDKTGNNCAAEVPSIELEYPFQKMTLTSNLTCALTMLPSAPGPSHMCNTITQPVWMMKICPVEEILEGMTPRDIMVAENAMIYV